MGKRKSQHYESLATMLSEYAEANDLYYTRYSEYHMRIIQGDLVCFDAWTTAKYYIVNTEFVQYEAHLVERAGEKGTLPTSKKELNAFLNKLFYPVDFA